MPRPDPVDPAVLVPVDAVPRDVLAACAAQVRAIRDATPTGRPMFRYLTAQVELLEAAIVAVDASHAVSGDTDAAG